FGDEVESVRAFDPASQRTLRPVDAVIVHPARETIATRGADPRARILAAADAAAHPSSATRRLLEQIEAGEELVGLETLTPAFHAELAPPWRYLPAGAVWLLVEPDSILRHAGDELEEAELRHQERLADHRISFAPVEHYATADELREALAAPARRVELRSLEIHGEGGLPAVRFAAEGSAALRAELERA